VCFSGDGDFLMNGQEFATAVQYDVPIIVVIVAGIVAFIAIPKEAQPDIPIPVLIVQVTYPGISPEDSERLLVKPLETGLRSVEGIKTMTARAYSGVAVVILEFDVNFNKQKALADVRAQVDRAVHVRLDVVVERVRVAGRRHRDQGRDAGRHAKVFRPPEAVGIAERGPLHDTSREPQVRRAEARRAADDPPPEVQRSVLGPARRGPVVIGAAEDPALPPPPVAAGKRAQPAVARPGLELGPVDTVVRHPPQYRHPADEPVRVKVQRHPPRRIPWPAVG